jgi:hypothetical protein
MRARLIAAFAMLFAACGTASALEQPSPEASAPMAVPTQSPGTIALDARALRAKRTARGYTLGGQALVKDACQAARFDYIRAIIFPPQFDVVQFRRPGTAGLLCIQRLTWVTIAPRTILGSRDWKTSLVHTANGLKRIPIR